MLGYPGEHSRDELDLREEKGLLCSLTGEEWMDEANQDHTLIRLLL